MTRRNPADRIINRIGLDGGLQTLSNLYRVSDIVNDGGILDIQLQHEYVSITDDIQLYDDVVEAVTSIKYTNSLDVETVDVVDVDKGFITLRLYLIV